MEASQHCLEKIEEWKADWKAYFREQDHNINTFIDMIFVKWEELSTIQNQQCVNSHQRTKTIGRLENQIMNHIGYIVKRWSVFWNPTLLITLKDMMYELGVKFSSKSLPLYVYKLLWTQLNAVTQLDAISLCITMDDVSWIKYFLSTGDVDEETLKMMISNFSFRHTAIVVLNWWLTNHPDQDHSVFLLESIFKQNVERNITERNVRLIHILSKFIKKTTLCQVHIDKLKQQFSLLYDDLCMNESILSDDDRCDYCKHE